MDEYWVVWYVHALHGAVVIMGIYEDRDEAAWEVQNLKTNRDVLNTGMEQTLVFHKR